MTTILLNWWLSLDNRSGPLLDREAGRVGIHLDVVDYEPLDEYDQAFLFDGGTGAVLDMCVFGEGAWARFANVPPGEYLVDTANPPERPVPLTVVAGHFTIAHVARAEHPPPFEAAIEVFPNGRLPSPPEPMIGALFVEVVEEGGPKVRPRRMRARCASTEFEPAWTTRTAAAWEGLPSDCDAELVVRLGRTSYVAPPPGRRNLWSWQLDPDEE